MRPQQQNRRMRGRGNNNNNRKGPNPLTRSYESNGPDVKIRGTAQQIADKYATLARDAQSSGDRVIAENYLQHAEHYNRIIAAAQAQQQLQQQQQQSARDMREDADDDMDERDEFEPTADRGERNGRRVNDGSGPQPEIEGMPAEIALKESENRRASGNGQHHTNGNGAAPDKDVDQPPTGGEPAKSGEAASEAGAEDEAPRRPRRPRRPRGRAGDGTEAEGQAAPAEQDASQPR